MMGEEDRLRPLRVRIARHHRVEMLLRPGDQRRFESIDRIEELRARALHVEAEVNRDLVIAAAAGVQLAAERAELLASAGLDGHVAVLFTPPSDPPPRWGTGTPRPAVPTTFLAGH